MLLEFVIETEVLPCYLVRLVRPGVLNRPLCWAVFLSFLNQHLLWDRQLLGPSDLAAAGTGAQESRGGLVCSAGLAGEAHGRLWECGFHKDDRLHGQAESLRLSVPRLILPSSHSKAGLSWQGSGPLCEFRGKQNVWASDERQCALMVKCMSSELSHMDSNRADSCVNLVKVLSHSVVLCPNLYKMGLVVTSISKDYDDEVS